MAELAEIRSLFEKRLNEGIPNPPGDFHPLDLERVKDDNYLTRIILRAECDVQKAADMLWDILVWRKIVSASDLNESNIRIDYLREGALYPHGRDRDGCLLFIFKSKKHVKGQKDIDEVKKIVIYWFDRIEREETNKKITLFFDMDECGISNIDMELIKYLISLLNHYYPFFLNHIIVFNMPWILSAIFKVVKQLLPAQAVAILKIVNKDSLKDIVSPEQALTCWGGLDDYTFKFDPEIIGSTSTLRHSART